MSEFAERVYKELCKVPKGKVTTYRELAHAVGIRSPRAIGQAMRCNPYAPKVPCHRVVRSDGTLGGFAGMVRGKEIERKIALLRSEGVRVRAGAIVDFDARLHRFG